MDYSFFEFYELVEQSKLLTEGLPEGDADQYMQFGGPKRVHVAPDNATGRRTTVMPIDQKSIEAAKLLRAKKNAEFAAKNPWLARATGELDQERRSDQAGEKALGMGARVRKGARIVGTEAGKNPVEMGPRQQPQGPDFEDQLAKAGGEVKTYPMIEDMRDHMFAMQGRIVQFLTQKYKDMDQNEADAIAWKNPKVVKKAQELFKITGQYLRSGKIVGAQAEEVQALHDGLQTLFDHLKTPGA